MIANFHHYYYLLKMDPRVREIVQSGMSANIELINSLEEVGNNNMGAAVENCFKKNTTNADRFA
jgi:hypothetical protein